MSSATLPPIVLAFSAADPTGGAGVQADLLTLASMGCHALSVITAMCELLLPQTTILTPNSREARRLVQGDGEDDDELALPGAAEKLLSLGCEYVLITGTHENTPQVVNTLYGPEGVVRSDSWERLPGSYHGSGCTLAAAIAATLANGLELPEAVREAQEYTWQTLNAGFRPGMGQYIPDRFFWAREMDEPGTGKA